MTTRRLALVIGNSGYSSPNLPPLRNAESDGRKIASTLQKVGFEVTPLLNGTGKQMRDAILNFAKKIQRGDTCLFYYSGHAYQVGGKNYLIPVDVEGISNAVELDVLGIDAQKIINAISRGRVKIIILDACRVNPFNRRGSTRGPPSAAAAPDGLAWMQATKGTFIAYAAAPGQVAIDVLPPGGPEGVDEGSSPYAQFLAQFMVVEGVEIERMFKLVRQNVYSVTACNQLPWEASCLMGDFCFVGELHREERANERQLKVRIADLEREKRVVEEQLLQEQQGNQVRRSLKFLSWDDCESAGETPVLANALILGASEYPSADLRAAERSSHLRRLSVTRDVDNMLELFQRIHVPATFLCRERLSREVVMTALWRFFHETDPHICIVYFTGYGVDHEGDWILQNPITCEKELLSFSEFCEMWLAYRGSRNPSRRLLVILEACFSGEWVNKLAMMQETHGIFIQSACGPNEPIKRVTRTVGPPPLENPRSLPGDIEIFFAQPLCESEIPSAAIIFARKGESEAPTSK